MRDVFTQPLIYHCLLVLSGRPSDALPNCAQALANVALAQAQQLAIRKAAMNEKMSKSMGFVDRMSPTSVLLIIRLFVRGAV